MKIFKKATIAACVALTGVASAQAELRVHSIPAQAADLSAAPAEAETGIYVVQMDSTPVISYEGGIRGYQATKPGKGKKLNPNSAHVRKYADYLTSNQDQAIRSVGATKVYSYRYAFNGFAARMTEADAKALSKKPGVVQVWRDEIQKPQTSGSPQYIGITEGGQAWSNGAVGEDIVIGVIDTGVWPEHPSFADIATPKKGNKGPNIAYGPAPDGFSSASCDFGNSAANPADVAFSCNNKLLAARCYNVGFSNGPDASNPCGGNGSDTHPNEFQSARDYDGHGSHTAATAGGNYGVPASIGGEFLGNVSGIAPRARLSAYKICWDGPDPTTNTDDGCATSDAAAAIDQAVADGVDVINYSIGGSGTSFGGADDIAFLFAADSGVFVATSNGNAGPNPGTVGTPSGTPWITAVGATQDDGVFNDVVVVSGDLNDSYFAREGNGDVPFIPGTSGNLIPADPIDGCTDYNNDINGEFALVVRGGCSFVIKYNMAAAAGASAIIVYNDGTAADRFDPLIMTAPGTTIPGAMIGFTQGDTIRSTIAGGGAVTGTFDLESQANRVASFSSRGPNNGAPDIIKPDVAAPGVAILAAGTPAQTGELFMSINGTSMASPHVAGSFAMLKQAHPDWTPAIARSALMTTARQDLFKTEGPDAADPFDIGAGEIQPSQAFDPGLAYDANTLDYVAFSCENNFQLAEDLLCEQLVDAGFSTDGSDLNLPSIGIGSLVGTQTVTRTVTAVYNNNGRKTFNVSVEAPPGVDVVVSPSTLTLRKGQSADYQVTFTVNGDATLDQWAFGSLTWVDEDENYSVYSPIAVNPVSATSPDLFTKTVDADTATAGDILTYEIQVNNGPATGPITVTDVVPAGSSFVAGSETETVINGATSQPWSYDAGSNSLSWEGTLDVAGISVVASPAPFGYFPLANLGIAPFGCPSNCDDGAFLLNVPAFTYNGATYSQVIWSVNGTIEAGSASGLATSFANQNLPSPTIPNNLIAPFWRDLNMSSAGNWYVGNLTAGPNAFTVYEWANVPMFGNDAVAFSFQIWVGRGPLDGRIWFTYARVDDTSDGTVGAENNDGTLGDSYFYDGAGTPPAVGVDLEVVPTQGGTATLGFQVEADCSVDPLNVADLSSDEATASAVAVTSCQ